MCGGTLRSLSCTLPLTECNFPINISRKGDIREPAGGRTTLDHLNRFAHSRKGSLQTKFVAGLISGIGSATKLTRCDRLACSGDTP